jgi:probable F420-dependent oxidoreductase
MAAAPYGSVAPAATPKTVLAALGPKMTELAGQMTDGAHPCNVPPEHTQRAREILGPGKLLCVEQGAILETDAGRARAIARQTLALYLTLPNYLNHWKRLGFSDSDFAGGGSDRLIDAVIVWGDETAIRRRITEHWQAGADHVCVLPIGANGGVDERLLELLRPQ